MSGRGDIQINRFGLVHQKLTVKKSHKYVIPVAHPCTDGLYASGTQDQDEKRSIHKSAKELSKQANLTNEAIEIDLVQCFNLNIFY